MSDEIATIIGELDKIISSGSSVPFASGKCVIDRQVAQTAVERLRKELPDALADAKQVMEERAAIIKKAEAEAARTVKAAESRAGDIVDQHEIVKAAYKKSNEIVSAAQVSAHEIKKGAYEYVEKLLAKAESSLTATMRTMGENRKEIEAMRG